jgi:apolipoprotein N-acyltransferase
VAVEAPFGRAGGAICYDYDYPGMGLEHARLGVGIVALPSSDWRGIDPIHTQMAALRAIEGGFSLVRSTRFGLSGAIDAHGRLRARRSSFDGGDRVLVAELPARPTPTLYGRVGDALAWACLAYLVALLAVIAVRPITLAGE